MATPHATAVRHPARHTEIPRPSRRDQSSRIPSRLPSSSSSGTPKLSASPFIGPSYGQIGYSTSRGKSAGGKLRTDLNDVSMSVAQPALSIPVKTTSPAPPSPQHLQPSSGSVTPSPSADTPPPPSLVSGSSVSSHDSPRSNVLRRRPSVIGRYVAERQKTPRDSPFGQPLLQQMEGTNSRADLSMVASSSLMISDNAEQDRNLMPQTVATITQEPVELTYGVDGHLLSRQTPLSESSTTPSIPHSASPSQFSQSTAPTSLASSSPVIGFTSHPGMRSFTSLPKKISPRPSEPFAHPFLCQASDSGNLSSTSVPRPRTAPQVPPSPILDLRTEETKISLIEALSDKKPDPVHPPELAHLIKASPSSTVIHHLPPPRPSRDGTPDLTDHTRLRPVVQSGLPKLNTFQHRRKQSDNSSAASASAIDQLHSPVSHGHQRTPLSGRKSSPQKTAFPRNTSRTSLQSSGADESAVPSSESKTPDGVTKQKARFGFFSRKARQEPVPSKETSKLMRKGPVAGTGHEGYGKHVMRARNGSSSSTGSTTTPRPASTQRKNSVGSNSSKISELDEFLQQRLSPVYLRGEGKDTESQGRGSGSAFEAPSVFTPSIRSRETSHTSASSFDIPKPTADNQTQSEQTSLGLTVSPSNPPSRGRDASESFLESATASKHRSPSRRRLAKPRPGPKESASKQVDAPQSATAEETVSTTPISSRLAKVESHESGQEIKARKAHWLLFPKASKEPKQSSSKWNIFQKPRANATSERLQPESSFSDDLIVSTDAPAYYVSPNEPDHIDVEDLSNLMREAAEYADDSSSISTNFEDMDEDLASQIGGPGQKRWSTLSQSKSTPAIVSEVVPTTGPKPIEVPARSASTEQKTTEKSETPKQGTPKPSRLVPVGRIPQVTSRREQTKKPPVFNFSRPLAQTSPKTDAHSSPPLHVSNMFPQTTQKSSAPEEPPRVGGMPGKTSGRQSNIPLKLKTAPSDLAPQPLFSFPGRKNSDNSYSSSSVSGTMHFPTATTIAWGPGRNSRASTDETWPEYDDLIDHVLTPSPSSRHSKPYFEPAQRTSNEVVQSKSAHPRLGNVERFPRPPKSSSKSSSKASVAMDIPAEPVGAIAAALRDPPSVSTMRSRRSNSLCNSYHSQDSARTSLKHKRSNSLPQANSTKKEEIIHENPFNFRYRVLMTSKWLSFGRLLFSPVHQELSNPDDRVLVLDGLGNRDWSYYCAVSYPHTQIYSLGPSATTPNNGRTSLGSFGSLPNYRHFSYTTPGTDFPFPKGFFAAVVYRFPVVDSDAVLRAMISECKRVLRPGGYLEISAIDLDLANMGPLARRAIRALKTQMHRLDPRLSLKPASDHVQSLLGRRGFENLNRCIVGVPAAGTLAASPDGAPVDPARPASDALADGDDCITEMVARVGRWWYTRCYETCVAPGADGAASLWCDGELLRECEAWHTTFKLLVCYAQKPHCVKRRTVSL